MVSPLDVATLSQTSDGNTAVTGNAQPVAYIRDRANGYVLSQPTNNNRPSYLSAGINGRPALDFDGVNDSLFANTGGVLGIARNAPGVTVFAACSIDVIASGVFLPVFFLSRSGSSASTLVAVAANNNTFAAGGRRLDSDGAVIVNEQATYSTGVPYVVCGALNYSGASARVFRDGVVGGTNNSFHTAGNTEDANSRSVALFGLNDGAAQLLDGRMGDVLVYNRTLSDAEISVVNRWLGNRYGVSVA